MWTFLSWLLKLIAGAHTQQPTPLPPDMPEPDPNTTATQILRLVNDFRMTHDLAPLVLSITLEEAAEDHAEEMAEQGQMAHTLPGEPGLQQRVVNSGYMAVRIFENIAAGQRSPEQVVEAWANSRQGHREAMLNATIWHLGAAVARSRQNVLYWCLVLGEPRRRGGPIIALPLVYEPPGIIW